MGNEDLRFHCRAGWEDTMSDSSPARMDRGGQMEGEEGAMTLRASFWGLHVDLRFLACSDEVFSENRETQYVNIAASMNFLKALGDEMLR